MAVSAAAGMATASTPAALQPTPSHLLETPLLFSSPDEYDDDNGYSNGKHVEAATSAVQAVLAGTAAANAPIPFKLDVAST